MKFGMNPTSDSQGIVQTRKRDANANANANVGAITDTTDPHTKQYVPILFDEGHNWWERIVNSWGKNYWE